MSSPGIEFRIERPLAQAATTRADVAVFAGLVARRIRPLPDQLVLNLAEAGWREGGSFPVGDARLQALLGIPIAVESWDEFDALFDWNSRAPAAEAAERLACPLGLAVRQFFLNGGARAWIIRCGDPLPLTDANLDAGEFAKMQVKALAGPVEDGADCQPILPGWLGRSSNADPLDSVTWQGAAAIFAIEDAAMLLLPDLPDLSAGPAQLLEPVPEPPGPPEEFRPCASPAVELAPNARDARPGYRAPRLTKENYLFWSSALKQALELLGRPRGPEHRRDVMLLAALPIPDALPGIQASPDRWPLDLLAERGLAGSKKAPLALFDSDALGNARLQLAYPWLATPDAASCPEGLQSPEGALAGLIAQTSLEQGAFRSAAGRPLGATARLVPQLSGSDIARGLEGVADWLGDRLCIFAERRGRIELVSDSTAASSRAWRKGGVSRLIAILLRAARHIGTELVFDPSGPELWSGLAAEVTALLEQLRGVGAFEGQGAAECYEVVCDRSTMTDADIDAGRVKCDVIVNPASPIERIVVTLALIEPVPALTLEAA